MSVILLKNINICYEGQKVLDIPRLKIGGGVKLAIKGESGSGKTTLVNVICGLERPHKGEVFWDDLLISSLNEFQRDRFRGGKVGLIMQDFHLYEGLSAFENALLPSRFCFRKITNEVKSRASRLLFRLNIKNIRQNVYTLSRGEKQIVAIARAHLNNHEDIIADEPTASLDAKNSAEVAELLLELSSEMNSALICVTHDANLARKLDFELELKKGEKVEAIIE
jgi:putative ABC transport system ATP-binding protein